MTPTHTRPLLVGALALCALCAALACQAPAPSPPQDVPVSASSPPEAPRAPDAPAAEEVAVDELEPREEGLRDPFSFLPDPPNDPPPREANLLDLNDMKLVGIVTGTAIPKAMFTDPDGFGHIITEGTRVFDGRVTDIRDREVVVTLSAGSPLNDYQTAGQRPAPQRRAQPSTRVIRLTGS